MRIGCQLSNHLSKRRGELLGRCYLHALWNNKSLVFTCLHSGDGLSEVMARRAVVQCAVRQALWHSHGSAVSCPRNFLIPNAENLFQWLVVVFFGHEVHEQCIWIADGLCDGADGVSVHIPREWLWEMPRGAVLVFALTGSLVSRRQLVWCCGSRSLQRPRWARSLSGLCGALVSCAQAPSQRLVLCAQPLRRAGALRRVPARAAPEVGAHRPGRVRHPRPQAPGLWVDVTA